MNMYKVIDEATTKHAANAKARTGVVYAPFGVADLFPDSLFEAPAEIEDEVDTYWLDCAPPGSNRVAALAAHYQNVENDGKSAFVVTDAELASQMVDGLKYGNIPHDSPLGVALLGLARECFENPLDSGR